MVHLTFLLGTFLALLGAYQIQAQAQPKDLPKGEHSLTLNKGPWGDGRCGYIYGLDKGQFPPRIDTFQSCTEFKTEDQMFKFTSTKPDEINVRIYCDSNQFVETTLKKIGEGKLTDNIPAETFEVLLGCHSKDTYE
ncbi:hypothetical protein BC941DRAFT_448651 [Chlamydoabsidia padenii]|nr:hypothetical protein BC941DRAFT_448651 [Chlamydoabsidia padenii]